MGVLWVAVLAAYWPVFRCGFVWNDGDYVTQAALRSWHGLYLIWFKLGATEQYYPLLHSAFWVEHRLWGDAPLGYHLVNVLIHAGSVSLLWVILRRLKVPGAWLAALLFAIHPVEAESVAWISEEKNTLSTLFYLAASWAYLRFDERRRWRDYGLGLVLFVCALLSKTVAATLPAALLVVFWWRRGRLESKRDVAPLLPWLAIGAFGGLFSSYVERIYIGANGSDFALSGVERVLVAGRAIWFYLGKLLWPAPLIFIYPRWQVSAAAVAQYGFPLAALLLTAVLWHWRGRSRGPLAGWLFFVGSLFPTLGFFNVYAFVFSYVADHWQYLASIGIFVLLGAGAAGILSRSPRSARPLLRTLIGAVAIVLGVFTGKECGNYRDMQTFYHRILDRNPAAWMAHNNLGFELEREGRVVEAIAHYREALQLHPNYIECHSNLGGALFQMGRLDEAIAEDRAALRLLPTYSEAHNNLGAALEKAGRLPEAIAQYQEASRLKPEYVDPVFNLAGLYFNIHQLPEAAAAYSHVLQMQPGNAESQRNLGVALCDLGRAAEGIGHLEAAARLAPADAVTQNAIGMGYYLQNQFAEAIRRYRAALRLNPSYPEALNNLGQALFATGKAADAIGEYREAQRLRADFPQTWYNLGNALQQLGRGPEAIAAFRTAIKLKPDYAEAHNNLGAALFSAGGADEGAAEFELALKANDQLADAHANLGVILIGKHRLPEALAELETALRLRPDFAQAELNYGQVLEALGRKAEAKAHLNHAAQLQADASKRSP